MGDGKKGKRTILDLNPQGKEGLVEDKNKMRKQRHVPVFAPARPGEERRRLGGSLRQPDYAKRFREELDFFRAGTRLVCLLPPVRPDGSAFRSDVDTSKLGKGEVSRNDERKQNRDDDTNCSYWLPTGRVHPADGAGTFSLNWGVILSF